MGDEIFLPRKCTIILCAMALPYFLFAFSIIKFYTQTNVTGGIAMPEKTNAQKPLILVCPAFKDCSMRPE